MMPDRGGVPASDSSDEAGNYGVERILAERMKGERMHYLVKWQGYSEEECTWEPPENFNDPQTLQEWQERLDIGDTLDEDGITALQKRMNAYIDSQYEEDRLGVSKRRRLMNGRKRRESSSSSSNSDDTPMKSQRPQVSNTSTSNSLVDDRTAHFKSPETAASPSLLPRLKVQPRRQSNPKKSEPGNIPMGPARSTPTEPPSKRASTSDPAVRQQHLLKDVVSAPKTAQKVPDPAKRTTDNRAGERFKTLQHRNRYTKSLRQEGVPDISRMELKAPEEWTEQSTKTLPSMTPEESTGDSWLFVPEGIGGGVASPVSIASSPVDQLTRPEEQLGHLLQDDNHKNPAGDHMHVRPSQLQGIHGHLPLQSSVARPDRETNHLVDSAASLARTKDPQLIVVNPFQPLSRKQSESSMPTNTAFHGTPGMITTRSGRLFKMGVDVLVHLSLNSHAVGDVKLLHIPPWLRKKLVVLKGPGEAVLRIDFPQQEVRTRAEYTDLAKNHLAPCVALGEIQAYDDTQPSADMLAEYLERESVCAMWIYPDPSETLVMILYSNAAPAWTGLGMNMATPTHQQRLRLLVRNATTSLYHRLPPHNQGPLRRTSSAVASTWTRNKTGMIEGPDDVEPMTGWNQASSKDTHLGNIFEARHHGVRDDLLKRDLPSKSEASDKKCNPHSLSAADFHYLTTISTHAKASPTNARIFIAFASAYPYEAQVLQNWLCEYVPSRNIFSDTEKNGWGEFCEASDRKVGVVLFHDKLSNYTSLTKLSSWLKRDSLGCFNVGFETMGRISLSRIFPRGTVLALTEFCMTIYMEQTLYILKWFETNAKGKTSSWKLILFPDAIGQCFRVLASPSIGSDAQKTIGEILGILLRLSKASGRLAMDPDEYINGGVLDRQHGTNDSFILSPPKLSGLSTSNGFVSESMETNQPAVRARDRLFSEYVLGWASLNCTQYRRFIVVDDILRNQSEPHSCHVYFMHPERFPVEYALNK